MHFYKISRIYLNRCPHSSSVTKAVIIAISCGAYFAKTNDDTNDSIHKLSSNVAFPFQRRRGVLQYSRLSPKLSNRNDPTNPERHDDVSLVYGPSADGLSRHTEPCRRRRRRRRPEICPAYRPQIRLVDMEDYRSACCCCYRPTCEFDERLKGRTEGEGGVTDG